MDWYAVGYFLPLAILGVVEVVALFNRRDGDTLSEHVWRWVGVGRRWTLTFTVRRVLVFVFLAWLCLHLTFGWFTPSAPLPWR